MLRIFGFVMSSALTGAAIIGIVALIALDFQEAIDALSTETSADAEAPSGASPFGEDPFEGIDGITFFISEPLPGTSLEIVTGASFSSAETVVARQPDRIWCYANLGHGLELRRITLGNVIGDEDPSYSDLAELAPATLDDLDTTVEGLAVAAKTLCRFDNFDPSAAS